jgi:hypothetical protein
MRLWHGWGVPARQRWVSVPTRAPWATEGGGWGGAVLFVLVLDRLRRKWSFLSAYPEGDFISFDAFSMAPAGRGRLALPLVLPSLYFVSGPSFRMKASRSQPQFASLRQADPAKYG